MQPTSATDSCVPFFLAEHRQTERLLALLEQHLSEALACGDWELVQQTYTALAEDLLRHFALEEASLFALLSPYRTMMLMTVEHDELLDLQHALAQAIFSRNMNGPKLQNADRQEQVKLAFDAFQTRLTAHILEEERGIFPLAEALWEPEEKQKSLRLYQAGHHQWTQQPPVLARSTPAVETVGIEGWQAAFAPDAPAMRYQTLYSREHTALQCLSLRQGTEQSMHWMGQHHCLLPISGKLRLKTLESSRELALGEVVIIDSQVRHALLALEDSQVLLFKVWPHPHYTKASG